MFFSAVWYAKSCTCGITFVDINVSQTYAEELGFLYEQGCGCKMPYVELERGVGGEGWVKIGECQLFHTIGHSNGIIIIVRSFFPLSNYFYKW